MTSSPVGWTPENDRRKDVSAQEDAERVIRSVTAAASRDLRNALTDALQTSQAATYNDQWIAGYLTACEAIKDYGEKVTR